MPEGREHSGNGLLWGAVILGGGYLLAKKFLPAVIEPIRTKQYVMRLRVNLPAVRFHGDNVDFDLYIQNPNSYPLTINAIVGDVFVTSVKERKTIKLGNLDRYGTTVIKPAAETKFTFSIRLKFLNLLQYFQDIVAGRVTGSQFTFIGNVNINGRLYPIKQSYKLA